jgi:hypothetical protein
MVDCSECKNCYIHPVAWGEYWCRIKEAKTGDGWVYESLRKRNIKKEGFSPLQKKYYIQF